MRDFDASWASPKSQRRSFLLFLSLAGLYISQGLPYGFFTQALPVYLRQSGQSLALIGATSALAFPWAFKFLLAPFVDHFSSGRLGPRKSWIIPLQLVSVALTAMLGSSLLIWPATEWGIRIYLLGLGFLACNILSASQDVATDAFAVDHARPELRGLVNTIQVGAYRLGMLIGGAALLALMADWGLGLTLVLMSLLLLAFLVPVTLFQESSHGPLRQDASGLGPRRQNVGKMTLREWWVRLQRLRETPHGAHWFFILFLFKIFHQGSVTMLRPHLVDSGFTMTQVAETLGLYGTVAGFLGSILAGALIRTQIWLRSDSALSVLATVQFFATASIVYVVWFGAEAAGAGISPTGIWLPISLDAFVSGFATVTLFTAMMNKTSQANAGSDYAIQASVVVISQVSASAFAGAIAQLVGLRPFFLIHLSIGAICLGLILISLRALNPKQAVFE